MARGNGAPSDEELARTVEELRAENARLRGLLGLDTRAGDEHHQGWAPTLLTETAERPVVDVSAGEAEKVALLRSLFGARSDVYATRWENASSGKSGWSPAMRGGWSKRRSPKDHLPLTDEVLLSHLRGEETVGLYPLLPSDRCALLACDFDKGTWALDALAYLDACHANGVPAVLERSRSGDGAHVWVFFDGPVPAAEARAMGAALLRQAIAARAELDLASYDRFFPSQDFLPKAGFGNLIALPLQGECARRGTTLFLDPTSLEPWEDQWAFLSSTARMTPDAVAALATALRPVDAGPALSLAELANADGPASPATIQARLGAMLSLARAGLSPQVIAALKHLGSIANPEFYEKQRMRFSTWNTPRFITAYDEDLEWLHLPRGLRERVEGLVDDLGSRLELADDRTDPRCVGLGFVGALRAQQAAAVEDLVPHDLGVLVAPPGAGKTVMACAVIAHHDVPTLVVVDRTELVDQWRARLEAHLNIDPARIGQIGGGKNRPGGVIDITIAFQCGPTRHEIKPGAVEGTELVRRELVVHHTDTEVPDPVRRTAPPRPRRQTSRRAPRLRRPPHPRPRPHAHQTAPRLHHPRLRRPEDPTTPTPALDRPYEDDRCILTNTTT